MNTWFESYWTFYNIGVGLFLFAGLLIIIKLLVFKKKKRPKEDHLVFKHWNQRFENDMEKLDQELHKFPHLPKEAIKFWQRFSIIKDKNGPPEWASTHPADKTRMRGLQGYLSRAKYDYKNVKIKYGVGEIFRLPKNSKTPDKPKAIPGLSVETLIP